MQSETGINPLEEYKKAVKSKYEKEKLGIYNSYLIQPSRAKLRDLCSLILSESPNKNDTVIFSRFLGFEFSADNKNKLKANTDKFRPIENFLKNESDLLDIDAVDMAALLTDFTPRPYAKFLKNDTSIVLDEIRDYSIEEEPILTVKDEIKPKRTTIIKQLQQKSFTIKQLIKLVLITLTLFLTGFGIKSYFYPIRECMQWQTNHYEVVDCNTDNKQNNVIPIEKNALNLKKIEVNSKTIFFINKKAVIWYCKNNGKLEYFDSSGFHPENGKPLKPISIYIINKYVKK